MRMRASVSVPVLSVHNTSIEPRSWIAVWRLTMICCAAMRMAPRDKVTDTTMGSSSGVRPTASATANKKDSSKGRCSRPLTSTTNMTSSTVSRMMSMPKRRMPSSKEWARAGRDTLSAMPPISVSAPVLINNTRALPLMTEVPMKTACVASCTSSAASGVPGCFSTG